MTYFLASIVVIILNALIGIMTVRAIIVFLWRKIQ